VKEACIHDYSQLRDVVHGKQIEYDDDNDGCAGLDALADTVVRLDHVKNSRGWSRVREREGRPLRGNSLRMISFGDRKDSMGKGRWEGEGECSITKVERRGPGGDESRKPQGDIRMLTLPVCMKSAAFLVITYHN
jgi:hypothetical protein